MGANSTDEAFELYRESKEIFLRGGFNLRKFVSNCKEVQFRIDAVEQESKFTSDRSESYAQFTLGGVSESIRSDQQKVLGVPWSIDSDELVFNFDHILSDALSRLNVE